VAVANRRRERAILTAAPESERPALADLRRVMPSGTTTKLAPGIFLFPLPGSFSEFARRLQGTPPEFIRHVQPVQVELPMTGDPSDLERLTAAALELAPRLLPDHPFSVQTRLLNSSEHRAPHAERQPSLSRFEINESLAAALTAQSQALLDVRHPYQVLSVLVTPAMAYLGVSRVEENLSSWAGGAIRYAREPDQISRAEFKLLEAAEVFHLTLPVSGRALDLGASPGGWTRILRRSGMNVTAVDPGEVEARLRDDAGIQHVSAVAQEYRCQEDEFCVIVNDMRMDARDSARLMLSFAPCLAADGWALMTLKLPERAPEAVAHQAIGLLLRRYRLLGARQLYHNRSEITVALSRRTKPDGAEDRS
jgi:23S rRNA (cytidine2498-2'-O)-methyltransferase